MRLGDQAVLLPSLKQLIHRQSGGIVQVALGIANPNRFGFWQPLFEHVGRVGPHRAKALEQHRDLVFRGDHHVAKLRQHLEPGHNI